jgi:hypothetical protein
MDTLKLAALRDFAIQHFPRAQTISPMLTGDDYNRTLYGFAALVPSTAPAVVQAAAALLQPVMRLSISWDAEVRITPAARREMAQEAVDAAQELCTITGTIIPWLGVAAILAPAAEPAAPPPPPVPAVPARPILQPGPNQTTADAARYLGVQPNTMLKWVMMGTGPLQPVKLGTRHGWPTAELERLGREGWTPRRSLGSKKSP